ncbi:hypothetical protein NEIRO03_0915 [Nematocida sp. AWRm78]|nr:hypothetical protein NEIRO02_0983 [Nematocida sp. AWRm79]KAI5183302.1 hypothetical protein NEIRO03_0915 [Nematocida sp. AWRm78]
MKRSIRIFLIIFIIFTFITIKKIVYIVIDMNKNKSKTRKSILGQICSVQESEPIDKIGSVSTTTLPIKNQNSGFTTAISAEEVKKEEHLETKEESFEMIDSNPNGTTADEKELIRMLNDIAKLNPGVPKVNYTKDKEIINAIIKNKDVVVIKRQNAFSISKIHLKVTLWEVLNSAAQGKIETLELDTNRTIEEVIISYPNELQQNPIIAHALLGHYENPMESMLYLTLNGFNFPVNASIFNKYDVFDGINTLILAETHICSSTLSQLGKRPNIKKLNICKNTVVDFDSKLDASLLELSEIVIDKIDGKCIDPLLTGLLSFDILTDITISNINFMSTSALNNITKLSKVDNFTLRNIVFDGSPDFSFLKKMDKLSSLTMHNIFYSYTDEFKIEDLDKIKQASEHLRIAVGPEDSYIQKQAEVADLNDTIRKNKSVGECISPVDIHVDSKLYNDLGLYKLQSKDYKPYKISIQLAARSLSIKSVAAQIHFHLTKAKACIESFVNLGDAEIQDVLNYLKYIDFPFTQETTINEIEFTSFIWTPSNNNASLMQVIYDRMCKYADKNEIKKLMFFSTRVFIPIDMYKIVMFNNKMPTLKEMTLSGFELIPTKTPAQNEDERNALDSYYAFIKEDSFTRKFHFVKDGNIMKIEQKPKIKK